MNDQFKSGWAAAPPIHGPILQMEWFPTRASAALIGWTRHAILKAIPCGHPAGDPRTS
jgi:hypothetical protein